MIREVPGTPVGGAHDDTRNRSGRFYDHSRSGCSSSRERELAKDIAYELGPYLPTDLSPVLTIQQSTNIKPRPLGS